MRKFGMMIMAAALVLHVLTGCGKESEQEALGEKVQAEGEAAFDSKEENSSQSQEETETQEAGEQEEKSEEEAKEEANKPLYSVKAQGIDYLSAEGIQVPEGSVIAMVGKDSQMEYWKILKKGAQAAVEDLNEALGYSGSQEIELLYDAPENEDIEEQIDIIDQVLDKNPQVLCIGFVDVNSGSTQMELAQANGIPVLTMDSGVEHELVTCSVQTDNRKAAIESAQAFFQALGGSGEVALLVHSPETQTGIDREEGFRSALAIQSQYPGIQLVEVLYLQEEKESALAEVQRVMKEHPDLKGWFGTNQTTTELLLKALEETDLAEGEEPLLLGGFDAGEAELLALEEGRLVGTVVQNPYAMGYAAVIASARELTGMANASQVYTDSYWVTQENLEDPLIQQVIGQ